MTIEIGIGKVDGTVEIDFDSMPANTVEYVIKYGLTQILNDAHSAITEKAEPDAEARAGKVWELVNKKLDALKRGELRVQRSGGGRTADPVLREARRLATEFVTARLKAKGLKPGAVANFAEMVKAAAAVPARMELARANVAAAAEIADESDDLPEIALKGADADESEAAEPEVTE